MQKAKLYLEGILVKITTRVTIENRDRLKLESKKTGLSMAYIVDLALNRYWGKK